MTLLLDHLRRAGAAPMPHQANAGPLDDLLVAYRRYLTRERGLTEHTVRLYLDIARLFVSAQPESFDLRDLTTAQVTAFVSQRMHGATSPPRSPGGGAAVAAALSPRGRRERLSLAP
ncbi:MAG: hypothetical protein QOH66_1539 [Actinomycetota bacterium]|jgi:hypothetical protein|nr:hypothetical protein [Actinomycetota bacterium]